MNAHSYDIRASISERVHPFWQLGEGTDIGYYPIMIKLLSLQQELVLPMILIITTAATHFRFSTGEFVGHLISRMWNSTFVGVLVPVATRRHYSDMVDR